MPQSGSPKTPSQLNAETFALLPDNTIHLNTPFNTRQVFLDLIASTALVPASTPITGGVAGKILYDDGTSLQEATVGSGLSLSGGTLTATGGGGGGTPGGSSGQVQYNNSGSFGGLTVGGDATLNTGTGSLTLANTSVAAGTYGDSTHVAQITVDSKGRATTVANVAISGSSLTVTDGTHSVAGTTQVTFSGATVSGSTPNATVTVSGGGGGTSDGTLNVTSFPAPFTSLSLVADGIAPLSGGLGSGTDNATNWTNFITTGIKTFGKGQVLVGVTLASNIFTYANHGLQPGAGLLALTTAGGVVTGTTYYVMSPQVGTYTKDTFQLSTTNNELYGGETLLTVTGSATYSFQMTGVEKIKLVFPPGYYYFSNGNLETRCGVKWLDIDFNGAYVYNSGVGDINTMQPYGDSGHPFLWAYLTSDYNLLTSNIINVSTADAAKFTVGAKVMVCGVDPQSAFGGFPGVPSTPGSTPINNFIFDYARITAINLGTGAITLDRTLSSCYLTTWPIMYSGIYPDGGPGTSQGTGGGAACLVYLHPGWDSKRVYRGMRTLTGAGQVATSVRDLTLLDCQFDDRGPYPSVSEKIVAQRCSWGTDIEYDKMAECAVFEDCEFNIINCQSGANDRVVFNRCNIEQLNGTIKHTVIRESKIGVVGVGPSGQGLTESLTIENSDIGSFQPTAPFWAPSSSVYGAKFNTGYVGNYTFTNGILTQPIETTSMNFWAIPGAWMYFADYGNRFDNMGPSFRVVDIYSTDAAGTTVKPGVGTSVVMSGPGVSSTPVDIVVTAATISGGTPTNGDVIFFTGPSSWPYPAAQQLIPYFPFKVINFGGPGANKFNIATLAAPSTPVQGFSWPGSPPNLTAVRNVLFSAATTLKALPTGGSTSNSSISFTNASGNLQVNWTAHGLSVDDSVFFKSTGGLPSTVTSLQPYYIISTTTNSFQIAQQYIAGGGGGAVAFGSGASGTITAIANAVQLFRHPCPRFTGISNEGGQTVSLGQVISTMNGAVDEPLYSRCKFTIGGLQESTPSIYNARPYAWGYVKQITINVLQPCTISNNFTLSFKTTDPTSTSLPVTTTSMIIDTTVVGPRTITFTSASSPAGASDTIAAITKWLTGTGSYSFATNTGNPTTMPLIEIEILTDQTINNTDTSVFVPYNYHTQVSSGNLILSKT